MIKKSMIMIYEDYIESNGALRKAVHSLDRFLSIDATDILNGALKDSPPDLFIMPGGADLYYCEKLNGDGNRAIRDYVAAGGAYLGICAGAYYGSRMLDWDHGAISGPRELDLLPVCAHGPISDFLPFGTIDRSQHHLARLSLANDTQTHALYTAGCSFDLLEPDQISVLARYADLPDTPPAIIAGSFGKGRVILSGVHPEYDRITFQNSLYHHMNPDHDYEETLCANSCFPDDLSLFKDLIKNARGEAKEHDPKHCDL